MSSRPVDRLNLVEFQAKFFDEGQCAKHLAKLRWPDGFQCPKCNHIDYYWVENRSLYQCKACKHQTSITAGTVMHKSKLPLLKWFWAIYLCVSDKRGVSATALADKIDVSYPTAWFLLHKIRSAMAERDSKYQLIGTVEMDDAFVGGKSKHTPGTGDRSGRGTGKAPVIVALSLDEDRPAFLRMKYVQSISKVAVSSFALDAIAPGAAITTDSYISYNQLVEKGYRHTSKVYKYEGPEFLKWLHTIISNLKAFIDGTYHGLSKSHLQSYLNEFCYRFNRRWDSHGMFDRLALATMFGSHLAWKDLVIPKQEKLNAETTL